MTHDEATGGLSSADAAVRLRAARYFALSANAGDRRRIQAALRRESIPWIRRALERSLDRVRAQPEPKTVEAAVFAEPPQRLIAELRAKAIDEVAGTIIHELSTTVASLKLAARRDVQSYTGSRTETLINSLGSLLEGIRNLKAATSKANFKQCDLAQECRQAAEIFIEHNEIFRFAGPNPYLVEIDPDLLKIALTNVLKNAVESVTISSDLDERFVTINWGRAGNEFWVSVLDTGLGFEREPSSLIEFGKSTKKDHIGFGLGTAKQAMQVLEGDVYPANAMEGGARVELRWFCGNENPAG